MRISDGVLKHIIRYGNGETPKEGSTVTVHCIGWLADSHKKFWSTREPGQSPFTFQIGLGHVIQGWEEGCLTMQKGETSKLFVKSHKACGRLGFPVWGIHPNADLLFEIEVLNIQRTVKK